jgi:hypothetical protein
MVLWHDFLQENHPHVDGIELSKIEVAKEMLTGAFMSEFTSSTIQP